MRIVLAFFCAISMAVAASSHAGTVLIDDFSDGDDAGWRRIDQTADFSLPWGPGDFSVVDGAYRLLLPVPVLDWRAALAALWDDSADPKFANGYVRLRLRTEDYGTRVGLLIRLNGDLDGKGPASGYAVMGDTELGTLSISRFDDGVTSSTATAELDLRADPFAPNEDWIFEAGAHGDLLTLKAWRVGEPEPDAPQLTLTDRRYLSGQFGPYTNTSAIKPQAPAQVYAVFDDISFHFDHAPGDANGDGEVDLADFNLLKKSFGTDDPFTDFDENGVVDLADFNILKAHFGEHASVPEPSTWGLACCAAGLVAWARRRRKDRSRTKRPWRAAHEPLEARRMLALTAQQVPDVHIRTCGSNLWTPGSDFYAVGEELYYLPQGISGDATENGLWKTDGTREGTMQLAGFSSRCDNALGNYDGEYLNFTTFTGTAHNWEWRTDGTPEGTIRLPEIYVDPPYDGAATIEGTTYFVQDAAGLGAELWKRSAGSNEADLVVDLRPGGEGSSPRDFQVVGDKLLFTANDGSSGRGLWATDGTIDGTELVRDVQMWEGVGGFYWAGMLNGRFIFQAALEGGRAEIGATDGTPEGTTRLAAGDSRNWTVVGDQLFFEIYQVQGRHELWRTDGTLEGTLHVANLQVDRFWTPQVMLELNGKLLFVADDPSSGWEWWTSDGTRDGTTLLTDLVPGPESSNPTVIGEIDGRLLFSTYDGVEGHGLWSTDGTKNGTIPLADLVPQSLGFRPTVLGEIEGRLFFPAYDGDEGGELWSTDGTLAGTKLVADMRTGKGIQNPSVFDPWNEAWLFTAGDDSHRELWTTDGTEAGTIPLTDARYQSTLYEWEGKKLFVADDDEQGRELWITDGTPEGTAPVTAFAPSDVTEIKVLLELSQDALLFTVETSDQGLQLWLTDGTREGTASLTENGLAEPYLNGSLIAFFDGEAYFRFDDGIHGSELWKTDGTQEGTVLVADLVPGPQGSQPRSMRELNGTYFVEAVAADSILQLWRLAGDGEAVQVTDLKVPMRTGIPAYYYPARYWILASRSFYYLSPSESDNGDGYDLWKLTPPPGDADYDGDVDLVDFNLLKENFGREAENLAGDLNVDGAVDLSDFLILQENFGLEVDRPIPPASTPAKDFAVGAAIDQLLAKDDDQ